MMVKVQLYLQNPPRVQWVLKVFYTNRYGTAIARTWFQEKPKPREATTAVLQCLEIAKSALFVSPVGYSKYQVEVRS